jgi:hypothetical protein
MKTGKDGKRTLERTSECGVAAITGDQKRDHIGQRELPDYGPVPRKHLRSLIDDVERGPNYHRDDDRPS